jgi:hypothetical protein
MISIGCALHLRSEGRGFTAHRINVKAVGFTLCGSVMSLDGVYDSRTNRKAIFNCGMTPNIPENSRGRKTAKRGRKRIFDADIFAERFRTIERVFAWEEGVS